MTMRPSTVAKSRVPMATSTTRPITAQRLRTSQIPSTSAGHQPAFLPSHSVQIMQRPITGAGGLARSISTAASTRSNIQTSSGMPTGRLVQDSNYFLGLLRTKHIAIQNEIHKINANIASANTNQTHCMQLENTFQQLLQQVKDLEGLLADYNVAMDIIARGKIDMDDMVQHQHRLQQNNHRALQEIDDIFLMKQDRENQILLLQTQIAHAHQQMENKLQNMEPDKIRAYKDLVAEVHQLHQEGQQKDTQMMQLRRKIHDVQSTMRADTNEWKHKYKQEEQTRKDLQDNLMLLQEDLKLTEMNPKLRQTYLIDKFKHNQAQSNLLDQEVNDIKMQIQRLQALRQDLQSNSNHDPNTHDQQMLLQQDEQITSFLQSFEHTKSHILQKQQQTKTTIVSLLKHISDGILCSDEELPTKAEFQQIKGEVTFKAKHLQSSELTMRRLEDQKARRIQELEQINTIEDKIAIEQHQLDERIHNMQTDIEQFNDISGLQSRCYAAKDCLNQVIEEYKTKLCISQNKVQSVSSELETNKRSLERAGETWRKLNALEEKLRNQGQNIFSLQEFIAIKGRQTNFESIKKKCLGIVENLNVIAIELS